MDPSVGTRRSTAFDYDIKAGYLCTALRVKHTVLHSVCGRPAFWIFLCLHLFIKWAYNRGSDGKIEEQYVDSMLAISWADLKLMAAMTTFFQVFYTNQCFSRYSNLYASTRAMMSACYDLALQLRINVGDVSQDHTRLALRYLACNVMLFFCELDGKVDDAEWQELGNLGLMTHDERLYIERLFPQEKRLMLLYWCSDVAFGGYKLAIKKASTPPNTWRASMDTIQQIRSLQQEIVDTLSLPIPFAYFHLLSIMIVVNLFFLALGLGATLSVFASIAYVFASIITVGMMEVASDMADPFGQDDVDFPVSAWMGDWLHNIVLLCEAELPSKPDWSTALVQQQRLKQIEINTELFCRSGFAESAPVHWPRSGGYIEVDTSSDGEGYDAYDSGRSTGR